MPSPMASIIKSWNRVTRMVRSLRSGASSPSYTGNKLKFTWRFSDNSLSLINLSRNRIFTEHYTPQFEWIQSIFQPLANSSSPQNLSTFPFGPNPEKSNTGIVSFPFVMTSTKALVEWSFSTTTKSANSVTYVFLKLMAWKFSYNENFSYLCARNQINLS